MKKTVILSGAAGLGLNTLAYFFETTLKQKGYHLLSYKNYMSRIRGGFNFTTVTFSDEPVNMIEEKADVLIALDQNAYGILDHLKPDATILTYERFKQGHSNEMVIDSVLPQGAAIDKKSFPMMALGALFKIFGIDESSIDRVEMKKWGESTNQNNKNAVRIGYTNTTNKYTLESYKDERTMRLNGNQAVALGAMSAGLRFFSAYPMAPSTGIMMTLSKFEEKNKMIVEQVEDEIAGIIAALGASSNGVRSMTATSGGGFSLMVEGLGFAGVAELPIVIANVQRPGPATGLPTRTEQGDLEFISRASQGEFPRIILAPTTIEACFYESQRAFNLADKYQLPVVILTDQFLADSNATIPKVNPFKVGVQRHINTDIEGYKRYDFDKVLNGRKFPGLDDTLIMNDSHVHDEHGHMTEDIEATIKLKHRLMSKLDLMVDDLHEPTYIGDTDAKEVFIGWGSTVPALIDTVKSLNDQGKKVGALLFTDVFPVPQKTLIKMKAEEKTLINVEQNYNNQFGKLILAETGVKFDKSINKYDGRPLTAEYIIREYEVIHHDK
ncbi:MULTISPECIES: 2-oxoacid:acceptor oxidoreductase subunit alpha [unclassified Fusibacter]|uniref:2-oxoacid:acceptor oxidoreductase subunit alpha n=1 Tax=unclassified Fusibacter TaxID=2624464 RepID=UPI0013E91809|nr:2-oxoacid:acceptor oxidoreductase subunit alpha [Fusibacter sp. A1]MCK8061240.1 2-oxoacid:acceptor oxidoreductase subunit alpha [Fusibacter sp. A2]NPE23416.1 2-oxoacid:acceptor oxidoreductase subunit alpha [Fusibacter sp. A1]